MIKEVNASGIRRVAISDKGKFLFRFRSTDSFIHGNCSRQSITGIIYMVGSNFAAFRGYKEECVVG